MPETNWAGNLAYRAAAIHRPRTLEELQERVAATPRLRVLGSRHSFNDIADSDELVALDALPPAIGVDREAGTVSLNPAVRYGTLAEALAPHGLALHNLASLPHISVAGAVATATHGSGDAAGNLATAVAALELVTSGGGLVRARRGDPDFDGMVVSLGALGVLTRITLDVQPFYEVRQDVFEGLAWEALLAGLGVVAGAGDSVSVFTRWGDAVDQVWVKTRVGPGPQEVRDDLLGAPAATVERHPILGLDAVNCTPQLGRTGPWFARLPHFRMGFTPSSGDELQSEFHVDRAEGPAAIEALRAIAPSFAPLVQVTELRTIAADALWLSPQYERDTLAFHFTWAPDAAGVDRALAAIEPALAPFGARPHWGKVFRAGADELAPRYPRLADFRALARRLDPRGAFVNDWLQKRVGL
ncbi:MAG: FAD-binding protein [Actinomycetota bacterium]|nr:FAD-binding protein [Actinomycetota bacterium]